MTHDDRQTLLWVGFIGAVAELHALMIESLDGLRLAGVHDPDEEVLPRRTASWYVLSILQGCDDRAIGAGSECQSIGTGRSQSLRVMALRRNALNVLFEKPDKPLIA